MTDQDAAKGPEKTVDELIKEIRREPAPRRMLELARALQAALDKRDADQK